MTTYERELYRREIQRLTEEVKRLRTLLEMWQQSAMMDYAKPVEVPSGPRA
jgi:hypothetical protein